MPRSRYVANSLPDGVELTAQERQEMAGVLKTTLKVGLNTSAAGCISVSKCDQLLPQYYASILLQVASQAVI